jgi:hypothetical protein
MNCTFDRSRKTGYFAFEMKHVTHRNIRNRRVGKGKHKKQYLPRNGGFNPCKVNRPVPGPSLPGFWSQRKFVTLGNNGAAQEFNSISPRVSNRLPVFGDVEGPVELEVSVVIVIDEARGSVVVATGDHA